MNLVKEIAVDPESLVSRADFRYLFEKLGFWNGLLCMRIPKAPGSSWEQEILRACRDPIDRQWIEAQLASRALGRLSTLPELGSSKVSSWEDTVRAANIRRKLELAITNNFASTKGLAPPFLPLNDVDESLLSTVREVTVRADAKSMMAVCLPLVRQSSHLYLVDPYFKPLAPSRLRLLKEISAVCRSERCEYLTVITSNRYLSPVESEGCNVDLLRSEIQSIVSKGRRLTIEIVGVTKKQDDEEGFHARYLLSAAGGIRFDHGFELDNKRHDVALIDKSRHEQLVERYFAGLRKNFEIGFDECFYGLPKRQ